jgi:hypothetical protein
MVEINGTYYAKSTIMKISEIFKNKDSFYFEVIISTPYDPLSNYKTEKIRSGGDNTGVSEYVLNLKYSSILKELK